MCALFARIGIKAYLHILTVVYSSNIPRNRYRFTGRSEPKRVRLQRPHAVDDGQYVRQNVHGEFPVGHGRVTPSDRHQRRHRVALGLVQRSPRVDTVAVVFRSRPDQSGQFRIHAVAPGRPLRKREMR